MASYAAAIKDTMGIEVATETGVRGQFDVVVNGQTVVSRKGGLLALLTKKPWPSNGDVLNAIRSVV